MFTSRRARREDFKIIASFPQSQDEQFYMFPRGTFPLDPVHLEEVAKERLHPTVILSGEEIAGYCNLYDVEADSRLLAWERDHQPGLPRTGSREVFAGYDAYDRQGRTAFA